MNLSMRQTDAVSTTSLKLPGPRHGPARCSARTSAVSWTKGWGQWEGLSLDRLLSLQGQLALPQPVSTAPQAFLQGR